MRVGGCPGVGREGWLRWFAHPFEVLSVRGACPAACFCSQHRFFFPPGSSEMAVVCVCVCVCMNFLYLFGPVFAPTVHAQGYF